MKARQREKLIKKLGLQRSALIIYMDGKEPKFEWTNFNHAPLKRLCEFEKWDYVKHLPLVGSEAFAQVLNLKKKPGMSLSVSYTDMRDEVERTAVVR